MQDTGAQKNQHAASVSNVNRLETYSQGKGIGAIGKDIIAQLMGIRNERSEYTQKSTPSEVAPYRHKEKRSVFSRTEYFETNERHEKIAYYREQIRKQVAVFKASHIDLAAELHAIDVITLNSQGGREGVYDVSFLEIILKILTAFRKKITESEAWRSETHDRSAKRKGSYKSKSGTHGTSYSQSQEIGVARLVQ